MLEQERQKRAEDASKAFFDEYIPLIQNVLTADTLPHLELLHWQDKIPLPQAFFEALALSPVKYLKLFRVAVSQTFTISPQWPLVNHQWPLRTLFLELYPHVSMLGKVDAAPLSASILRLCSQTLETLTLETTSRFKDSSYTFNDAASGAEPQFPNLRRLHIGAIIFKDFSMLKALVVDKLRYLELGIRWNEVYLDYFKQRGSIPCLETLVWNGLPKHEPPYRFLRANPQITKFSMLYEQPKPILEGKILQTLTHNFSTLTSLHLIWKEPSILDSALEKIVCIKSLKQIHLTAGEQFGWKHDWLINHDSLRRHLCNLPLLQKIALSRDTYTTNTVVPSDHYYEQAGVLMMTNRSAIIWERGHRHRMLREAKMYVNIVPNLDWIYLGEIPMGVSKGIQPDLKMVTPLTQERDSCWTLLRKMFGGGLDC